MFADCVDDIPVSHDRRRRRAGCTTHSLKMVSLTNDTIRRRSSSIILLFLLRSRNNDTIDNTYVTARDDLSLTNSMTVIITSYEVDDEDGGEILTGMLFLVFIIHRFIRCMMCTNMTRNDNYEIVGRKLLTNMTLSSSRKCRY